MGLGTRKRRSSLEQFAESLDGSHADDLPLEDRVAMGLTTETEEKPHRGNGRQRAKVRRDQARDVQKTPSSKKLIEVDPISRAYATFIIRGLEGSGFLRNRYQEGLNGAPPPPTDDSEDETDEAVMEKASETKLPPAGGEKSRRKDRTPFDIAEGCSELISDGPNAKIAKQYGITWEDHEKLFGFPGSGFKKGLWEGIRATNMKLTMTTAKFLWMVTTPVIPILDGDCKHPARWEVLSLPVHNERADVFTISHRQLFPDWGMKITIDWNEAKVDIRVMTHLMRVLGTIGIGCYTVPKNGAYGLFQVISVTDPHFYEV